MNYTHKDQFGRNARVIAQDVAGKRNVAIAVQVSEDEEEVLLAAPGIENNETYLVPWATTNPALRFKPYNPWEEVAIDTPVWVRDSRSEKWMPRHFAGIKDGKPTAWLAGKTSHTGRPRYYHFYDFMQLEKPNGN